MAAIHKRTMTATEAMKIVGLTGTYRDNYRQSQTAEVYWLVRVLDVRTRTRVDYLVEPVHGSGSFWCPEERVTLKKEKK